MENVSLQKSILMDAYAEVSYVLDILGNKYKDKIPKKILDCIYKNKNNNYIFDENTDIQKIKFNRNTLIIISILNLKYWEKDENEIKRLKKIYSTNEQIYQRKINEYKNDNWIKRDKREPVKVHEEKKLIILKNESIWSKIKRFIKNIFQK